MECRQAPAKELRQLLLFIQVDAVAGDVLGDNDALLYAAVREGPGLGEDVLHPAAAVLPRRAGIMQ